MSCATSRRRTWGYTRQALQPAAKLSGSKLRASWGRAAGVIALGAAMAAVAGCGALPTPPSEQAVEFYTLADPAWETGPAGGPENGPLLLVSEPLAAVPYDSQRIAYVRGVQRVEFYGRSEWAGEPTRLIEPLLVDRLERTGAFSAIVTGASGVLAQYRLDTEIYELQQRFANGTSEGRVALRAQLLDLDANVIVATRTFSASEPAGSNDPAGGAAAMASALSRLVTEIAEFTARHTAP